MVFAAIGSKMKLAQMKVVPDAERESKTPAYMETGLESRWKMQKGEFKMQVKKLVYGYFLSCRSILVGHSVYRLIIVV